MLSLVSASILIKQIMIRQTAIFDKFRILTVLLFIWRYYTIPRNGWFWWCNKRISLFFIALFSVFLRLVVIICYRFVRWWQGKNQNFKKLRVNGKLGKWIWGYGYPINKKHPRPFTLTAYRLAGVRCCRSLVLMVSAAVALWVAVGHPL